MTITEIKKILEKEINQKGYSLEERKSTSTDSWYFKIYSGAYSLMFRVANHKTKANITTLRLDKKVNRQQVEQFAANRCKDLSKRVVKSFLLGR